MKVETLQIDSTPTLDSMVVYWTNYEPGRGSVTITCWGSAWTCFFGAMSKDTIQEFFSRADVGYLVNKLGNTEWLKQTKRHEKYLARVIEAVKTSLSTSTPLVGQMGTPAGE